MTFEICLNDLRFYSFHGVYDEERVTGNEFIVNLKVNVEVNPDIERDDILSTVSYVDLFEIVEKEMSRPRKLLEKVALEIKKDIEEKFPMVKGGEVSIEKKHPPIPKMLGSAIVRLKF